MKTVLGMFAMMAVATSLLTSNPASAQDKKPVAKKPVVAAKKPTTKKVAAKKGAKPAHADAMAHAKKK